MASAVSVHNLRKTYAGHKGQQGVEALKGVSLTVEDGDFFALLGPNGAGKSTLIGIISSLVNKTAGDVSIFGVDIARDPSLAKTYIGLVPQEMNINIFEKVEDIVATQAGYYGTPRPQAIADAEPILKDLGLWEKRHAPAQSLSGGMKRRLMIARALIHKPRLLILDEPTAGVDVELRRQMWTFLRQMNEQGTTIILTTHYLEEAEQLCRNVAIINKGRILINESMEGLLKRHGEEKLEEVYLGLIESKTADKLA
ncbi:MAG: ABC transporter ATP-binding protein [Patescibacteria group bacterium]|nr:ABC transporter ATP-binding protein [Patescibacteria group bacterium]